MKVRAQLRRFLQDVSPVPDFHRVNPLRRRRWNVHLHLTAVPQHAIPERMRTNCGPMIRNVGRKRVVLAPAPLFFHASTEDHHMPLVARRELHAYENQHVVTCLRRHLPNRDRTGC